jgi:hypothetical protein
MSNPTRDVRRGRISLTALTVGLHPAALVSGSAAAGKGSGGGGKGGGKPGGSGTLTGQVVVSPNPVPAYSQFRITGCGYVPNGGVQFNLYSAGGTAVWGGVVDASGCLYNASGWANSAGSARLDVLAGSVTTVASTTFTIK